MKEHDMEVLGDTTHYGLGLHLWGRFRDVEVKKNCRVTGDTGEHRIQIQHNRPSLAVEHMEWLGLVSFFRYDSFLP